MIVVLLIIVLGIILLLQFNKKEGEEKKKETKEQKEAMKEKLNSFMELEVRDQAFEEKIINFILDLNPEATVVENVRLSNVTIDMLALTRKGIFLILPKNLALYNIVKKDDMWVCKYNDQEYFVENPANEIKVQLEAIDKVLPEVEIDPFIVLSNNCNVEFDEKNVYKLGEFTSFINTFRADKYSQEYIDYLSEKIKKSQNKTK